MGRWGCCYKEQDIDFSHLVDVDAGEEGGAGGETVEAELGADLAPDQQVGEVQREARLVSVLRHHEVTHLHGRYVDTCVDEDTRVQYIAYLVVDGDDEPAPHPELLEQPADGDQEEVEEVHGGALHHPVDPGVVINSKVM